MLSKTGKKGRSYTAYSNGAMKIKTVKIFIKILCQVSFSLELLIKVYQSSWQDVVLLQVKAMCHILFLGWGNFTHKVKFMSKLYFY